MTASAGEVTAASTAATAGMAGDMGNAVKRCAPMTLHIGVFFDGTGNNTANARAGGGGGGSYANARSNVSPLTQLYKTGSAHDVRASCGGIGTRYASLYVQGIGTKAGWSDGWPDNIAGAATGMGMTGVEARVMGACTKLGTMIQLLSRGVEPREIVVDVFGFSRGAAAARYCVNCFRQGVIRDNRLGIFPLRAEVPEGRNLRFRFVGIFDTVAAIGDGRDADNGNANVHLKAAQATAIYHLTARHEYRTDFRLNHNIPGGGGGGTRQMLGAHSDVGGGHRAQGDTTRVKPSATDVSVDRASAVRKHAAATRAAALERDAENSFWVRDGWIRPDEPTGGLRNAPSPIRTVVLNARGCRVTRYAFTTGAVLDRPWVRVGLSRIPLRIMYDRAVAAGVPLLSFPTGPDSAVPAPLRRLAGPLASGGAMPSLASQRAILHDCGHVSAGLDRTGMAPQLGDRAQGQRYWHRTVYRNVASRAK